MDLPEYRRPAPGTRPNFRHEPYRSTLKRSPAKPLVVLPQTLSEITGPMFGHDRMRPTDADLTRQHERQPIGERIIIGGRGMDEDVRPIPNTLVEMWQANSTGRYRHRGDQ